MENMNDPLFKTYFLNVFNTEKHMTILEEILRIFQNHGERPWRLQSLADCAERLLGVPDTSRNVGRYRVGRLVGGRGFRGNFRELLQIREGLGLLGTASCS